MTRARPTAPATPAAPSVRDLAAPRRAPRSHRRSRRPTEAAPSAPCGRHRRHLRLGACAPAPPRPADDHRRRPPRTRRPRRRGPGPRHGQPVRAPPAALPRPLPPRRRRRPRLRRRPGRPAPPRRPGGQGRHGLHEPGRARGCHLRAGRPLHRAPARGGPGPPRVRRGEAAAPHRPRRPRLPGHPARRRPHHRRHGRAPAARLRRAVLLPARRRPPPQRPGRRRRDHLHRHRVGPRRDLRVHLAQGPRHRGPGRHGPGHGDVHAARGAARRGGGRRPRRGVREVARGAPAADRTGWSWGGRCSTRSTGRGGRRRHGRYRCCSRERAGREWVWTRTRSATAHATTCPPAVPGEGPCLGHRSENGRMGPVESARSGAGAGWSSYARHRGVRMDRPAVDRWLYGAYGRWHL
ncbi:hypothetical protein SMICM304S_11061 [Streptomyces microflavus]